MPQHRAQTGKTGGMFAHRTKDRGNAFAVHRMRARSEARRRLGEFADYLADGLSVRDAARKMGVSRPRGSQLLAQIRREIGWQAQ